MTHLYENLMRVTVDVSGSAAVSNGMAKSYSTENNHDGTVTWTFRLRSAKWSDGRAVKAEDFVYAWRRLADPASGSPYAGVGLSREMVTVIACELPLVLVLLSVAKTVGDAMGTGLCFSLTDIALYQAANGSLILKASMIPAAAAMLLIIPGETGNHPFDAAEAETEICEGMLAEYSGAPLGVYKLNHAIKMLTLTSLFVALFLGGIGGGIEKLVALIGLTGGAAAGMTMLLGIVILLLLCIALTAVSISFVHAITARLKIEQIFKYYWTVVSGLALISLVLAWYGM